MNVSSILLSAKPTKAETALMSIHHFLWLLLIFGLWMLSILHWSSEIQFCAKASLYLLLILLYLCPSTHYVTRFLCGNVRSFDMAISDQTTNEVIRLFRPLTCQGCCCSALYPHCTQVKPRKLSLSFLLRSLLRSLLSSLLSYLLSTLSSFASSLVSTEVKPLKKKPLQGMAPQALQLQVCPLSSSLSGCVSSSLSSLYNPLMIIEG